MGSIAICTIPVTEFVMHLLKLYYLAMGVVEFNKSTHIVSINKISKGNTMISLHLHLVLQQIMLNLCKVYNRVNYLCITLE